uniref:Mannosyltransferase n=1 Tax=Anopheles merus TaxID=30066 RepID=A0A182UQ54_ANOME
MWNRTFWFFVAVRIASVFLVTTWFVPDEYWQSLEVAHRLAFGYGHLTWEWAAGMRSYLYPATFAGLYKLLALVGLDSVELLTLLPRILQACLSAYADYRFHVWCRQSKWSTFLLATSWCWFYVGSRTLANTLETSLTMIALSYFPWASECTRFLWPVALSFFVRPTSVIPWVPLCLYHIKKSTHPTWELLLKRYLLIGLLTGALCVGVDSYFHGAVVFSSYEFLKYNVLKGVGSFYGEHPWYWYLSAGLPTVLGVSVLPFLAAGYESVRHRKVYKERAILLLSVCFTVLVYSLLAHKEFRFLLPVLPMCLFITADYLARWSRKASSKMIWFTALLILSVNGLMAGYTGLVHQRGTLDVMPYLATTAKDYRDEFNNPANILFLMPCHSTPFYSHVHQNVTMRFLHCEPNLTDQPNYLDEAHQFYANPMGWVRKNLPVHPLSALPTHVVTFDVLEPQLKDFLSIYQEKVSFFHTDYPTERVGGFVKVYERYDPLDWWREEEARTGLVTFCKDLDLALGSGIPEGMITELCGPPGSGKTQFCLQLAVNVQIPQKLGGLQGRAVYLDTNYGFSPQRVQEMAQACHNHCANIALLHKLNPEETLAGFSEATALDNILYSHVTNCTQILEAIAVLQNRLYDGEKVIVTNDVTTRISDVDGGGGERSDVPQIVSALGGSLTHKVNQRIFLGRDESHFDAQSQAPPSYVASIEKGHFLPSVTVAFRIEPAGIRGVNREG